MDLYTIKKLCELYDRFYDAIRDIDKEIVEERSWPVCRDPGEQREQFEAYLKNLPQDEWTHYYICLSQMIHDLVFMKPPHVHGKWRVGD